MHYLQGAPPHFLTDNALTCLLAASGQPGPAVCLANKANG